MQFFGSKELIFVHWKIVIITYDQHPKLLLILKLSKILQPDEPNTFVQIENEPTTISPHEKDAITQG